MKEGHIYNTSRLSFLGVCDDNVSPASKPTNSEWDSRAPRHEYHKNDANWSILSEDLGMIGCYGKARGNDWSPQTPLYSNLKITITTQFTVTTVTLLRTPSFKPLQMYYLIKKKSAFLL